VTPKKKFSRSNLRKKLGLSIPSRRVASIRRLGPSIRLSGRVGPSIRRVDPSIHPSRRVRPSVASVVDSWEKMCRRIDFDGDFFGDPYFWALPLGLTCWPYFSALLVGLTSRPTWRYFWALLLSLLAVTSGPYFSTYLAYLAYLAL
jgi:hypothetical protein